MCDCGIICNVISPRGEFEDGEGDEDAEDAVGEAGDAAGSSWALPWIFQPQKCPRKTHTIAMRGEDRMEKILPTANDQVPFFASVLLLAMYL
jgi:hypothetical protein